MHKTALKRRFKTSNIAVLIKILFEFTRSFELQNVVRKSNSFQYKLAGLYLWGLITGCIFLFTDRGAYNVAITGARGEEGKLITEVELRYTEQMALERLVLCSLFRPSRIQNLCHKYPKGIVFY